ncbi:MAG: winged helix-turn-helix domain-containing protein, partial [Bacillota bacterium]|nr:winged helix-turn-helix domain-containing protein [Bacillota bacterium]
ELTINRDTMEVRHRGRLLPLFPQETRILCHLATNPGRIYTPAQIYTSVTGGQNLYLGEKSVKAQMSRLRSKLPLGHEWIITRRGLGYTFSPQAPCTLI